VKGGRAAVPRTEGSVDCGFYAAYAPDLDDTAVAHMALTMHRPPQLWPQVLVTTVSPGAAATRGLS
jgi:hypothetical protein